MHPLPFVLIRGGNEHNIIIHDNSRLSLIPNMDRLCTGTCVFVITWQPKVLQANYWPWDECRRIYLLHWLFTYDDPLPSLFSEHALTPSSSGTSLSLASRQLSQMDKLPQAKRDAIWSKAWNTWSTIGNRCICKRLPTTDQLRTLLKSQKTEEIDQFFRVIPSQTFLVHLLQIFPHVYLQLRKTFAMAQFEVLSSILQVKYKDCPLQWYKYMYMYMYMYMYALA